MQLAIALFLVFCSFTTFAQSNEVRLSSLKTIKRVAFGSCNSQLEKQPLWKDIVAQKPDLWIWGGDTVYADWGKTPSIEKAYQIQNAVPDYIALKAQVPMMGIWDDHDYGYDNAEGSFVTKKDSQKHFQDFLEVPVDSKLRVQEGIYNSRDFGEAGQKIKIIMLDNRYFKGLDPEYPLLGKTQWEWLEKEFKNSTASLHIIVAGLSIFSPTLPYTEEWRHYPKEVNRLLALLKLYNVKAPLFLTGDLHFSSIFRNSGQLEFLSSGMTHTASRKTWKYISSKYPTVYFGLAYGIVDIEWEGDVPKLDLYMRNGKKDIHRSKFIWKNNTWTDS